MDIASSFEAILTVEGLIACITLALLEIVLGIDNLIFISILVGRVPKENQRKTRLLGLTLALVFRIAMLFCISWIIHLEEPVITLLDAELSWRDIILLAGGMFLLSKSTLEIHHKIQHKEDDEEEEGKSKASKALWLMLLQIIAVDMVFSIDSILTAVGLTEEVGIMIVAVVAAMGFMMIFARWVGDFINKNPTIVILALAFLIMIGLLLILDAFHVEVPRGYVYFAMGFAFVVELLNLKVIKRLRGK